MQRIFKELKNEGKSLLIKYDELSKEIQKNSIRLTELENHKFYNTNYNIDNNNINEEKRINDKNDNARDLTKLSRQNMETFQYWENELASFKTNIDFLIEDNAKLQSKLNEEQNKKIVDLNIYSSKFGDPPSQNLSNSLSININPQPEYLKTNIEKNSLYNVIIT